MFDLETESESNETRLQSIGEKYPASSFTSNAERFQRVESSLLLSVADSIRLQTVETRTESPKSVASVERRSSTLTNSTEQFTYYHPAPPVPKRTWRCYCCGTSFLGWCKYL